LWPEPLGEQDEPTRLRRLLLQLLRNTEREHAPALGGRALGFGGETVEVEVLRRAEHVADAPDPLRAEAAAGRERHLLLDPLGLGGVGRGDRLQRRVAGGRRSGVAAERPGGLGGTE